MSFLPKHICIYLCMTFTGLNWFCDACSVNLSLPAFAHEMWSHLLVCKMTWRFTITSKTVKWRQQPVVWKTNQKSCQMAQSQNYTSTTKKSHSFCRTLSCTVTLKTLIQHCLVLWITVSYIFFLVFYFSSEHLSDVHLITNCR